MSQMLESTLHDEAHHLLQYLEMSGDLIMMARHMRWLSLLDLTIANFQRDGGVLVRCSCRLLAVRLLQSQQLMQVTLKQYEQGLLHSDRSHHVKKR